jgi:hypothetical protein
MSQHQPFNPRLVVGLVVAGILAFAALVLLLAFGSRIGTGQDGRAHALSVSAVGYKGLVDLVGTFTETHLVEDVADLDTDHLAVIAVEPQSRAEDVRTILNLRGDRPTLIILPKWQTVPDRAHRGWVRGVIPGLGGSMAEVIGADVAVATYRSQGSDAPVEGQGALAGLRFPVPRAPQGIEGQGIEVLVPLGPANGPAGAAPGKKPGAEAPSGPALVARVGEGRLYVVADPDLVNNHGLRDPATARAALAMIERLNTDEPDLVDFDLTVNGLGAAQARSMLRLAFEPPFLAMTLALFVAALLAGLHGAFRFGPVRRPERAIAFGKAALVENSAGLIRLAGREARLGGAYADVVRQDVARAVHAPPGREAAETDAYLDRLGPRDGPSFSALAAELARARDRHALMAAARAMMRWKREVVK